MNLSREQDTLWYENSNGDKWYPNLASNEHPDAGRPDEFMYQHSKFSTELTHSILKIVQPAEVEACDHPPEHVHATGGWIEGIRGRECKACNGTQTVEEKEKWPEKWDAHGSRQLMTGRNGWSEDLALALCNAQETPSDWGLSGPMKLGQAILISANACERCMNALAHGVGLDWGYPEFSEEWQEAKTSCDFCTDADQVRKD